MSRKATVTVDWKQYGLSTSLDVEAPDLVTYFKLKCSEIENQSGWVKSPYDTYSHNKWFTIDIETDADDETLQAAIDNGDLQPDSYEGDIYLYTIRVNKGTLSFSFAFQVSPAEELDYFSYPDIQTCDLWFTWKLSNGTVLESCLTIQIPPFGSSDVIVIPAPSTPDEYYRDINERLQISLNTSKFDIRDIQAWIVNGSFTFQPEIRRLQYRSSSSKYADCVLAPYEDWNQSSAKATDYASSSFAKMYILFLKMIYYDAAIALGYRWIDSDADASNYAVYMIRNVDGYNHTVSEVISYAASQGLYYAAGFVQTTSSGTYGDPSTLKMGILAAPTTVTNASSGFAFNNGNMTGSAYWNTCWLMIRFASSSYAHDFVEMIRSHCINIAITTPGSGVAVIEEYYEIEVDARTDKLEIPSGTRNGIQINFGAGPSGYSSNGETTTDITAEPGSVLYGSYCYVPLFKWVEYDVLNYSSAKSQGMRLIYSGIGVSAMTQHSTPAYFYPYNEDAIWHILSFY